MSKKSFKQILLIFSVIFLQCNIHYETASGAGNSKKYDITEKDFKPGKNNCHVWCLEESPQSSSIIKVLKDTTQVNNYEIWRTARITYKRNAFTKWREVICNQAITISIINEVQSILRKFGYFKGGNTNNPVLDIEAKKSLVRFQKENYLPVGQLDVETLNLLGISIDH